MLRLGPLIVAGLVGLLLAGCATPPTAPAGPTSAASAPSTPQTSPASAAPSPAASHPDFKACLVSAAPGSAADSASQTSQAGLALAAAELGIQTEIGQTGSDQDLAAVIQGLVAADCDLIALIGPGQAPAAEAAALAHPDVHFLLVDAMPANPQPNLKPLLFDPTGASFLAGYLAASQSQTGVVAGFGAVNDADVVLHLNGCAAGVAHYNQAKGAAVSMIGWDRASQDGQFVASATPFDDAVAGRAVAEELVGQGADIIFPVAGPSGLGALQLAQESAGQVSVIWSDGDGCVQHTGFCPVILTSVRKSLDVALREVIGQAVNGQFNNTAHHGTLANDQVGLSALQDFADQVGGATLAELAGVRNGLIEGSILPPAAG